MSKPFVLIMGIVAVLFVSGCSQIENIIGLSVKDLVDNPTAYLGKEVKVYGKYGMNLGGDDFINDEEGYFIKIEDCRKNRAFQLGESYTVSGIFSMREMCDCEYSSDGKNWWSEFLKKEINECESQVGTTLTYRCEPGSIEKVYFIECS